MERTSIACWPTSRRATICPATSCEHGSGGHTTPAVEAPPRSARPWRRIPGGLFFLLVAGLLAASAGGCGKRGNPLPPLRPVPIAVTGLAARRTGDRVEIRFTIPTENLDHSSPPSVTHVDIYGAVGPTSATPPVPAVIPVVAISMAIPSVPISLAQFPAVTLSQPPALRGAPRKAPPGPPVNAAAIMHPKYLRGHVAVRPPAPPADAAAKDGTAPSATAPPADSRPAPGESATYVEQVTTEVATAAGQSREPSSLRYVVVPVAGSNRNGVRSLVEVPLTVDPAPPSDPVLAYDETSFKLTWTAAAATQKFQVYRTDASGKEQGSALSPTPLATPEFSAPVEFGVERCFVVRTAIVMGTASVESAPAGPVCKTALDTFPPAAPAGLSLLPTEGKITVQWDPVAAADLAGYVVLRAEGPNATFQPLMQAPIAETNYTDDTTKVGVRYTYEVMAVDKAGNRSAASNTADAVGR